MPVTKNGSTILLGEDDLEVGKYLETALECQGFSVELAQDGEEVLACLRSAGTPISAVVLDIIMPRKDGMEALKEIRRFNKDLPVIMISGVSSPLNVVESMKNGANDFVCKPINAEDLRKALNAALYSRAHAIPIRAETSGGPSPNPIFFGVSSQLRELQSHIGEIGWCEAPVLIQGETGAGKEVLARELHFRSPRAKKPFLKLNCAALPSELVESELFGYERGAFAGAFQKKLGMFELADGGTILLDEIGDLDFKLQAELLQVLQDQEFQRLGGKETIRVNIRIIAATHRDLEKAISENAFREDLYYRLNVINVAVPPLREWKEDILPMAEFLVRKYTAPGTTPPQIPPALQKVFLEYHWPGNVRELENVIRKFLILRDPELIKRGLRVRMVGQGLASEAAPPPPSIPESEPRPKAFAAVAAAQEVLDPQEAHSILEQAAKTKLEAERSAIGSVLKTTNWNRKDAAKLLHIDYSVLLYKIKKLALKRPTAG